MNHDALHCADCDDRCPKGCYRAKLTWELKKRKDLGWMPVSWAHLRGSKECPRQSKEG